MLRVLVVEDSPTQAQMLALILEDAGFDVETAPDADRGFARLAERPFDLVLSDLLLPGDSGIGKHLGVCVPDRPNLAGLDGETVSLQRHRPERPVRVVAVEQEHPPWHRRQDESRRRLVVDDRLRFGRGRCAIEKYERPAFEAPCEHRKLGTKAGCELVEVSLPHTKYALPAYYIVAPAEASSNLARYDGVRYGLRVPGGSVGEMYENTRAEGFGAEVRRRVMIGTYVLSAGYYDAYYLRAQKVRTLIKKDFEDCFASGVSAILTPATPSAAFGIGERGGTNPVEMYLNDIFTVTVNMAGLPAMAVPAGKDANGLPLALQLIGKAFDEETLFSLGEVIEQSAGRFTPKRWW